MKNKYAKVVSVILVAMFALTILMVAGMMFCFTDVLVGFRGMCDECQTDRGVNIKIFLSLLAAMVQVIIAIALNINVRRTIKDGGTVNTTFCGVVNIILSLVMFLSLIGTKASTHGEDTLLISIYRIVCYVTPVVCLVFILLNVAAMITSYLYDKEKWRIVRAEKGAE